MPAPARELLELGPDAQGHLAGQHVERVDVVEMDVRLRAALAGGVPRPGRVQPLVVAEDPQLAIRRVDDRLALAVGGP